MENTVDILRFEGNNDELCNVTYVERRLQAHMLRGIHLRMSDCKVVVVPPIDMRDSIMQWTSCSLRRYNNKLRTPTAPMITDSPAM
jgi:hypothetical protein